MATMKRILCVGGFFDDNGGRKSGYFEKLTDVLKWHFREDIIVVINGGLWQRIDYIASTIPEFDFVLWGADIPNTKPKLVNDLKALNPNMMLVITKNNIKGKYSRKLLVARALDAKANLLLEFEHSERGNIVGTILDPLGNCFVEKEIDIATLGKALFDRLMFLTSMTRVGSEQVDIEFPEVKASSDQLKFFELTREYAKAFHSLIHVDDNGRMLGNISFRCENGFPTYRHGNLMLVSRRNIDKRDIGSNGMVPVVLETQGKVKYIGDAKPSVDTPIQRALYCAWPNANYMLHAHVYIEGAPFTETVIPCGAVQEVDEILKVMPTYSGDTVAYLNLKGHGSLAVARTPEMLENIPYIARAIV